MIILIPCGFRKSATKQPAHLLYEGAGFTMGLTWARTMAADKDIRIVSAMHGLVPLDRVLAPYNLKMGQPGSVSAGFIRNQAITQGIDKEQVVVAALPAAYADACRGTWPTLTNIYDKLPNKAMGFQRRLLSQLIADRS